MIIQECKQRMLPLRTLGACLQKGRVCLQPSIYGSVLSKQGDKESKGVNLCDIGGRPQVDVPAASAGQFHTCSSCLKDTDTNNDTSITKKRQSDSQRNENSANEDEPGSSSQSYETDREVPPDSTGIEEASVTSAVRTVKVTPGTASDSSTSRTAKGDLGSSYQSHEADREVPDSSDFKETSVTSAIKTVKVTPGKGSDSSTSSTAEMEVCDPSLEVLASETSTATKSMKVIPGKGPPPEPPVHCCMSGCANCVWILYAEELKEYYADGGEAAREALEQIENPSLKAFLKLELDL